MGFLAIHFQYFKISLILLGVILKTAQSKMKLLQQEMSHDLCFQSSKHKPLTAHGGDAWRYNVLSYFIIHSTHSAVYD